MYGKNPHLHNRENEKTDSLRMMFIIQKAQATDLLSNCINPHYSDALRDFISKCLQEVETRSQYIGLLSTDFYNAYADIDGRSTIAELMTNFLVIRL